MINYTPEDLRSIAAISADQHRWLLRNCGIHNNFADKILAMSDAELAAAITQFEPVENKTPMQAGLVAAAKRELTIRGI